MTPEHGLALVVGSVATILVSGLFYTFVKTARIEVQGWKVSGAEKKERFKWLRGIDVQDCLLAGGFIALETGVGFIDWRAACILGGILFFTFAYLIQRTKTKEKV